MAQENKQPIIIKKKKKGDHAEHSSAWKIALADFMTALMCFFLVMWLTSIMNTDVNKEVSKFFSAAGIDESEVGIGGILGGSTITVDGPAAEMAAAFSVTPPMGARQENEQDKLGPFLPSGLDEDEEGNPGGELDVEALGRSKTAGEAASLISQAIAEAEDEAALSLGLHKDGGHDQQSIKVLKTQQFIRIDLLDTYAHPMFGLGKSALLPSARRILEIVARKIAPLGRPITITGHTDGLRYHGKTYTNWELSSDRANAARRFLQKKFPNLPIKAVVGKAFAVDKRKSIHPGAENRRISIEIALDEADKPSSGPSLEEKRRQQQTRSHIQQKKRTQAFQALEKHLI